ncbi:MAG TPA: hypothetical protein VKH15_10800 [Candidatus Acidoferrum sp.]|nr:hypothetical protein [Candidatus Acidoferrum sp.]
MASTWHRRTFLQLSSFALPMLGAMRKNEEWGDKMPNDENPGPQPLPDLFPTQPPELTREMVTVAHFDLKRVKELVEARPSLAKAAWDWGFGDWESALGAASHMGNRPIAEYLLSKGARPSLFSAAMLGQVDVVKAFVKAQSGVQRIRGPHSISLLAHAKAGGEPAHAVLEFLQELGDADAEPQIALSAEDETAIRGTYVFGIAANQQIDVTTERGQALWTRKGTMGRPLFHLGQREFYPLGASAARIHFAEETGTIVMTVRDPDLVLKARKKEVK